MKIIFYKNLNIQYDKLSKVRRWYESQKHPVCITSKTILDFLIFAT